MPTPGEIGSPGRSIRTLRRFAACPNPRRFWIWDCRFWIEGRGRRSRGDSIENPEPKRSRTVSDEWDELDERRSLIRQVRQRLESLGRAGLVHIPVAANRKPSEAASPPGGQVTPVGSDSPG